MADTMTQNWNKTEIRPGEPGMMDKAENLVSKAGEKADDAVGAVGSGMKSVADTLREKAPDSGVLGTVASKTADTLDSAGCYLRDEGVTGILEDMTNCMRRNPTAVLLTGLGLGVLLAYATRRR
jgi:hypothetical protein